VRRQKRRKGGSSSMSDSDGDTGFSATASSTLQRTSHKQLKHSQADTHSQSLPIAETPDSDGSLPVPNSSIYTSKTSNLSTLPDQLPLPDLEDIEEAISGDRLGGPGISNFEGFTCLNSPSQLPLDSEVLSESESLLTPAQRTAGTKTTNNLDSEVSEGESLLTPAQRTTGTKNTTNLRDSVKPIQKTEPAAPNLFGKVIIIEPVADTHPVDKFFSNDLTLSKALADSPFGRAGIAGFSKNLGHKILVVTFERELGTGMASLLNINRLASWTIKCRLPVNLVRSVGVIGPLGEDVSKEDLAEALVLAGHSGATAERILKGKDKSNTSMFKVTFNSGTLPTFLYLGYQRFQVSSYIAKPWQCFKCQRFHHNAISCKNAPRCVACSGAHNVKDCSAQGSRSPLCCNCGGQHTANYGGCRFMKEAQAVERTRVEQRVSYQDALKMVKQSLQKNVWQLNDASSSGTNFSQSALSPTPTAEVRTWAQKVKSTHPQATNTVTTATQTNDPANSALQGLTVAKFIELVSKIIALCTKTDNSNIAKIVTELTRETLQLDCSQPASTADPLCPDPVPYQVPNTITSSIPVSQPNSAGPPGATKMKFR